MRLRRIALTLAAIAALLTGAAIAAPAQKRDARKTPARPAPTPAPTPAPAKKNAGARPGEAPAAPAVPTSAKAADEVRYFYEFSQPDFIVSHIQIEHDSAGRGQITFERRGDGKPITEPLEISPAAFARIVGAWEALRFLDTEASYQADKQFPNLGTVRLRMKQGARERTTEFNWTNEETARALAAEYRHLADQQLFVFDVDVARQYQPSETVKLLKRLESLLQRNEVSDAAQLAPLLSDLSTDERIPLMARNQAGRLLKKIQK